MTAGNKTISCLPQSDFCDRKIAKWMKNIHSRFLSAEKCCLFGIEFRQLARQLELFVCFLVFFPSCVSNNSLRWQTADASRSANDVRRLQLWSEDAFVYTTKSKTGHWHDHDTIFLLAMQCNCGKTRNYIVTTFSIEQFHTFSKIFCKHRISVIWKINWKQRACDNAAVHALSVWFCLIAVLTSIILSSIHILCAGNKIFRRW